MTELKRYTSSEIEEIDDALLEASEDGTIKMTRVYIASEADSVMESYEKRIKELEHHVPKWHQCEHTDSEGFYDLPPESGEYIVQVRSRSGRLETFAAEFDADYSDWTDLINGSVVIQWSEEPKPSIKTQTAKSKECKDNFFQK